MRGDTVHLDIPNWEDDDDFDDDLKIQAIPKFMDMYHKMYLTSKYWRG